MRGRHIVAAVTSVATASMILVWIWLGGRHHQSLAPETHAATATAIVVPDLTIRRYTSISSVDRAIDAELRADGLALQRLFRYSSIPCANAGGADGPACDGGEDPGTDVQALPVVDCRPSFQRPSDFRDDAVTSPGVAFYGAYDVLADVFPPGQYAVVFTRAPAGDDSALRSAFALIMSDGGIVGIDYGCDQTAPDLVASVRPTSLIASPQTGCRNFGDVCETRGVSVWHAVCSEGFGWTRPSPDDQRRYLVSLGGEFAQFASDRSSLFMGDHPSDINGLTFGLFWAVVADPEQQKLALARTGLWTATPNTKNCNRSGELTLLIERRVTDMRLDGSTLWITSEPVPGYFQFVQYSVAIHDHAISYRLLDEKGHWIDGCCA
jgi:hypothetical protein